MASCYETEKLRQTFPTCALSRKAIRNVKSSPLCSKEKCEITTENNMEVIQREVHYEILRELIKVLSRHSNVEKKWRKVNIQPKMVQM